jgi:aspartyl protease family protein
MNKIWFLAAIILINSQVVRSETFRISLLGLFPDQAVVDINGKQYTLVTGQDTGPKGVKLISANSSKAVINVNGESKIFLFDDGIQTYSFAKQKVISVANTDLILLPIDNVYITSGTINDSLVNFVIDENLPHVMMDRDTADRLSLDYSDGEKVNLVSADETEEQGAYITLDNVKIGNIDMYDVQAIVLESAKPGVVSLGTSFLDKLVLVNEGEALRISQAIE